MRGTAGKISFLSFIQTLNCLHILIYFYLNKMSKDIDIIFNVDWNIVQKKTKILRYILSSLNRLP